MPKYEICVESKTIVAAQIIVEAKDEKDAKKIGRSIMNNEHPLYFVKECGPRKVVDVKKIPERRRTRGERPAGWEFCSRCGLNEVFHPSKTHGNYTACESFVRPRRKIAATA